MTRDSVLFYRSFAEAIEPLNPEQQLEVFWAIINYGLDGEVPETGVAAGMLRAFMPVIDKNNRKFENRIAKKKSAGTNENKQEQTGTNENKQEQTGTNGGEKGERRKEKGEISISFSNENVSDVPTPYPQIIALYHSCCTTMPKVKAVSKARQASMRRLYKEYGMEGFEDVFAKAGASDFLTGRTGKWNGCGFDWLLKPANFLKVLEGNYDNAKDTKTDALIAWAMEEEDGQEANCYSAESFDGLVS